MADFTLHLSGYGDVALDSWQAAADKEFVLTIASEASEIAARLFQAAQDGRSIESGGIEGGGVRIALKGVYLRSVTVGGGEQPLYTITLVADEVKHV